MSLEYFKQGFYKSAVPLKSLTKTLIKNVQKTTSKLPKAAPMPKAPSKTYSSWTKTKKTAPSSETLNYNDFRREMTSKNIASRGGAKRQLSGISGKPVITNEKRYPWMS
jgi:hypothetical protein